LPSFSHPLNRAQEATDITVKFQPGDNGITCEGADDVIVEQVKEGSQAQRAGVKRGWKFRGLNGGQFFQGKYERLKAGRDVYTVTFQDSRLDCNSAQVAKDGETKEVGIRAAGKSGLVLPFVAAAGSVQKELRARVASGRSHRRLA